MARRISLSPSRKSSELTRCTESWSCMDYGDCMNDFDDEFICDDLYGYNSDFWQLDGCLWDAC